MSFGPLNLDGSNGFRLVGIGARDLNGWSVSGAGDVNGDGFDDIIIGAIAAGRTAQGGLGPGQSYVVFGASSGFDAFLFLSSLDGTNGFQLNGIGAYDTSGRSVSSAGDLNGDGFDDIIVGASDADPGGRPSGGQSYVVFGTSTGFGANLDLSSLDGTNGFQLNGISLGNGSGYSVSSAGDVNGDGVDDIIIGAPYAGMPRRDFVGQSYVMFGSSTGFDASIELSDLNGTNGFQLNGIDARDFSGRSVSGAGDVNGDGFDDIIVGASGAAPDGRSAAGESYVVFGASNGFDATVDLAGLDGTNGFRLDGVGRNDRSGFSVSGAGDVNGDGIDDVIVGAPNANVGGRGKAGASYVVFGSSDGFDASLDLSSLDGTNGFRIEGRARDDLSGFSVSRAGDVNGDGVDDIIVGASLADPRGLNRAGETFVVFGASTGFASSVDLADLDGTNGFRFDGIRPSDRSGYSVAGAGDVNGDGVDDIIIGAPSEPGGRRPPGDGYVVFGVDSTAPVVEVGQSFAAPEDRGVGAVVGTVEAVDYIGVTDFAITGGNANGFFAIDTSGQITLTEAGAAAANNNFANDPKIFILTVEALDAAGNTGANTVTITVSDVVNGGVPDASFDVAGTKMNTRVAIDVLVNDSDPSGSELRVAAVSGAENGSVVIDGDQILYTPDRGFKGLDGFTYAVENGDGGTDIATVVVAVGRRPIVGETNEDFLLAWPGRATFGEAGDDVIVGLRRADVIDGGSDDDVITGGGQDDTLFSGGGSDTVLGETGSDTLVVELDPDGADTILVDGSFGLFEFIDSVDRRATDTLIIVTDEATLEQEAFQAEVARFEKAIAARGSGAFAFGDNKIRADDIETVLFVNDAELLSFLV